MSDHVYVIDPLQLPRRVPPARPDPPSPPDQTCVVHEDGAYVGTFGSIDAARSFCQTVLEIRRAGGRTPLALEIRRRGER